MLKKLELYRTILLRAADEIRERGHCVGNLSDGDGRICVAAALNLAATGKVGCDFGSDIDLLMPFALAEAYQHLEDYLQQPVVAWNDESGVDAEQVIDVLERVALMADDK